MPIEITVPGSKSLTNRALMLATLGNKKVDIKNFVECDDTKFMIRGLKKLKNSNKEPIKIYTGNAGTTTRFLTASSTLLGKKVIIDGDKRMRKRPVKELTNALNKLGAKIETTEGCPPLTIYPQKFNGGKINLKGNISSQYISAIIMIAPFAENDTTVNLVQQVYSTPYINMTIKVMNEFGLKILNKNFKQLSIKGNQTPKPPKSYNVESDASSASYFGAYTALHPECTITLKNLHKNSLQGDIDFLKYLKKMGCQIYESKNGITIKGTKSLNPLKTINMNKTPDLVMTFAVLAMFTKGITKITNISNLRIKETDRISALKNEIGKFGIKVKTGKDFIKIEGKPDLSKNPPNKKISIKTYNDHRIAMSFGIIKDIFPKINIANPECVSKSYPNFWRDLKTVQKSCKK
ncbi:3-phosphoshikimate 1-carboxyvinyltransferase [Candidatus Peregrinibacteria bacterium]|nr:3-phosphoshikimate 1-carboxyvinyltransferase [Candidatus Peregrinibacteria bacterium]